MRGGRVSRMPFAVDDDDGNLALALGERVAAGMEMRTERRRRLHQFGIMHPDLARPAGGPPHLDQKAIALLLLRRHLVIGDLGIAAKSRRLRHFGFSQLVGRMSEASSATVRPYGLAECASLFRPAAGSAPRQRVDLRAARR